MKLTRQLFDRRVKFRDECRIRGMVKNFSSRVGIDSFFFMFLFNFSDPTTVSETNKFRCFARTPSAFMTIKRIVAPIMQRGTRKYVNSRSVCKESCACMFETRHSAESKATVTVSCARLCALAPTCSAGKHVDERQQQQQSTRSLHQYAAPHINRVRVRNFCFFAFSSFFFNFFRPRRTRARYVRRNKNRSVTSTKNDESRRGACDGIRDVRIRRGFCNAAMHP